MYMQVAVANWYNFALAAITAPSSLPFMRIFPSTAGIYDDGPSDGPYSSMSLHTSTGCMNLLVCKPVLSQLIVNLLPDYSRSSPLHLQVNAFSRSCWTCCTNAEGPSNMMPSTHATTMTNKLSTQAKYRHGSAFDCLYVIFLACFANILKKQYTAYLVPYIGTFILSTSSGG